MPLSPKEKKDAVALVHDALDVSLKDLSIQLDIYDEADMDDDWEFQLVAVAEDFVDRVVEPWYEANRNITKLHWLKRSK